jgi:hypothetical protein
MALLAKRRDGAEMFTLRTAKQSEDNLPLDQAAQKWNVLRRIEKVDKPRTCAEQFHRGESDGHAARVGRLLAKMKLLLRKNLPYQGHFEPQHQAEHRFLFGCRNHLADYRQIDRSQDKVRAVAHKGRLANVDSLLSLHKDNQAWLVGCRGTSAGHGAAGKAKAGYVRGSDPFRNGTIRNLASQPFAHLNHAFGWALNCSCVVVSRGFHSASLFTPSLLHLLKTKLTQNSLDDAQKCMHRQE